MVFYIIYVNDARIRDVCDGRRAFACETSSLDQPQYQPCETNCTVNNEESKTLVKYFNESKILEQLASEEGDLELIDERWYTLFIAEDKLQECPKVKVTIGNEEVTSIVVSADW